MVGRKRKASGGGCGTLLVAAIALSYLADVGPGFWGALLVVAAIEELKADGLDETPVPVLFPQAQEKTDVSYKYLNFSEGQESAEGRWAQGPSMDGKGQIEYVANPQAMGPQMDELDPPVEPRLYSTPKQPMPPAST